MGKIDWDRRIANLAERRGMTVEQLRAKWTTKHASLAGAAGGAALMGFLGAAGAHAEGKNRKTKAIEALKGGLTGAATGHILTKHAFLQGFLDKRKQKKRDQAHHGYTVAKSGWEETTAHHPMPKHISKKWDEEFHSSALHGMTAGYNFHSDKVNAWLPTPEGEKWNAAQAKKAPWATKQASFWLGFQKQAGAQTTSDNNGFETAESGGGGGDQQLEAIFGFETRPSQPEFPGKPMDGAEGPIKGEGRYVD